MTGLGWNSSNAIYSISQSQGGGWGRVGHDMVSLAPLRPATNTKRCLINCYTLKPAACLNCDIFHVFRFVKTFSYVSIYFIHISCEWPLCSCITYNYVMVDNILYLKFVQICLCFNHSFFSFYRESDLDYIPTTQFNIDTKPCMMLLNLMLYTLNKNVNNVLQ